MLRIANEKKPLQYSLSHHIGVLTIKMEQSFASAIAPEVGAAAYRHRGSITKSEDVMALGEFIPYRGENTWGYDSCIHVKRDDDASERWAIDMGRPCNRKALHTLDAVLTALNVQSGEVSSTDRQQRVEVDLSYDHRRDLFVVKAELSAQAVSKLTLLNRGEHSEIVRIMEDAWLRVTSLGGKYDDEDFYSLLENEQALTLGVLGAELKGQLTEAEGLLLVPEGLTDSDQVLAFLAGLATLDDLLADLVPPHL